MTAARLSPRMSAPVTSRPVITVRRLRLDREVDVHRRPLGLDVHRPGLRRLGSTRPSAAHGAILGDQLPRDGADLRRRHLGEESGGEHRGRIALAAQQRHHLLGAARGARRSAAAGRRADGARPIQQQQGQRPHRLVMPSPPSETSAPLHRYRIEPIGEPTCRYRNTDVVERIARVIAGRMVSSNAEGDDPSAGDRVDSIWRDYREDALSVLRTLREPDPAMAEAGDVAIWERMIEAALARGRRLIGRARARSADRP